MQRARDRTILDGFFHPRDAEDVRLACRALLDGSTQGSWGEVKSPSLTAWVRGRARAEHGGLLCERIFGPLADHRCVCGKYEGRAARGTLCEKCQVLCDSSSLRGVRWGHVVLPAPLRHPIGIDVELVPVVPPGDRPLQASDDPARPALAFGPVNEAYKELVVRAVRWRRLVELSAPEIILDNEREAAQRALDRLYATVREPPPVATTAWGAPVDEAGEPERPLLSLPLTAPPPGEGGDADEISALVWVGEDRLALQRRSDVAILDARDGSVSARYDAGDAVLTAAHGDRLVLTSGPPYPDFYADENPRLVGLYVLDVARGAWLEAYPAELPAVFWTPDQPEDAALTDFRDGRGLTLDVPSDRPTVYAWTFDQRFVWVGADGDDGLVVNTRDGLVYLESGALGFDGERGPVLLADGRLVRERPAEAEEDDEEDWRLSAPALALTADRRWRVLAPSGGAGELDGQRFSLGFRARAAAFDARGERLAILTGDAILVVDWEGPRLLARLPLADLEE